jgi:hypothetical protein
MAATSRGALRLRVRSELLLVTAALAMFGAVGFCGRGREGTSMPGAGAVHPHQVNSAVSADRFRCRPKIAEENPLARGKCHPNNQRSVG